MSYRNRRRTPRGIVDLVKLVVGAIVLLGLGGVNGLAAMFGVLVFVIPGAAVCAIGWLIIAACLKRRSPHLGDQLLNHFGGTTESVFDGIDNSQSPRLSIAPRPAARWTEGEIYSQIGRIDWYQFEKLNAAMLAAEGFMVERQGGANPDGGVDIIATSRDGGRVTLVQCKHWLEWKVDVKTVRELLGAMTHFKTTGGEIRAFGGWTEPAAELAGQHEIALVDGSTIARRARALLDDKTLTDLLNNNVKHCPKCESPMVLRTGDFEPFWGCTRFPRCRGVIKVRETVEC